MLLQHDVRIPAYFARASAGRSMAARMAMMAITTSNSIRVKPQRAELLAMAGFLLCHYRQSPIDWQAKTAVLYGSGAVVSPTLKAPFSGATILLQNVCWIDSSCHFLRFNRNGRPHFVGSLALACCSQRAGLVAGSGFGRVCQCT